MHSKNHPGDSHRLAAIALGVMAALSSWAAQAQDAAAPAASAASAPEVITLPSVRVKASASTPEGYSPPMVSASTGLALTPRDTPQSVSVLTRTLLDDFRLDNIDGAVALAPGMSVEKVETDRTYYTVRGFDVTNFQVDGIGLPLMYGVRDGDLDTVLYRRVEVVRGANGLMSGVGSPSAAINLVRKRPTETLQAAGALSVGSWNDRRLSAEVSGPLNADGSLRGLVIAAGQDRDSYLDRYHHRKGILHGALALDLALTTTLTLGHSVQKNRPRGVMWGALPLFYSDGSPTDYDVSTSTSPSWTYWKTDTQETYLEGRHQHDNGWATTARFTHTRTQADSKLFYVYGTPDRSTGAGLETWPSLYTMDQREQVLDLRTTGPFTLAGRRHEAVLGASTARAKRNEVSTYGPIGAPLTDLNTWNGEFPEPAFTDDGGGSDFRDRQHSVYAAARLQVTDALKFITGANATWLTGSGSAYGEPRARDDHKVVPYLGTVFDLSEAWSFYASHTEIFKPQSELGADLQPLRPAEGRSSEAGLKGEWLDGRLVASLSLFTARQNNLADWVTTVGPNQIYTGVDTRSQGMEVEIAGALTPRLNVLAGFTQLSIKDAAGAATRTYVPRRQLSASATWRALDALKVGASLRWRDDAHRDEPGGVVIRQPAYALLDLMARYDFNERLSATLNVGNVTNEKYIASLYWTQGYYGAPRHGSVSLNWRY